MRRINEAGLDLIKRSEGTTLIAYQDTSGVWTIGTGHTPARQDQRITQEQADVLLAADIGWAEDTVAGVTNAIPTSDNQFAAMVSLTFNIGASAFRRSTVLRLHLDGNHAGAADAFLMWRMDNGSELVGLVRRRNAERELYLEPDAVLITHDAIKTAIGTLQGLLKDAGFYPGVVDGDPGPLTIGAMRGWRASA